MKTTTKSWYYYLSILGIICFGNTLFNGFALDDYGLLTSNSLTEKGIKGISQIWQTGYRSSLTYTDLELYRPIPRTLYQLFYSIAPDNPLLPHFFSLIIYLFSGILLFKLVSGFYSENVSGILSAMFMLHPLHTEVVANAKGIEELLAFLFLILTATYSLKSTSQKPIKSYILASLFFFLALCSKESAAAFFILIPLVHYLNKNDFKKAFYSTIYLAIPLAIFLFIRLQAIGLNRPEIQSNENYLVLLPEWGSRLINALYIITFYLKQILLPIQLICDGSYAYLKPLSEYDWMEIVLPVGISLGLLGMLFKLGLKSRYAFGLLFFGISILPVSNILFLIGTNYGERLLFVPLLGILIAIIELFIFISPNPSSFFHKIEPSNSKIQLSLCALIFVFGIFCIMRNSDWKNNVTLFAADLEHAEESARLNAYYASALTETNYLKQLKSDLKRLDAIQTAINCYQKSLQILPNQKRICAALGTLYQQTGNSVLADSCFRTELKINPNSAETNNLYGNFLFQSGNYQASKPYFYKAIQLDSLFAAAWMNLGSAIGTEGKIMLEADSTLKVKASNLTMNQRFDSAIVCYQKALSINPEIPEVYLYAFKVYRMMGNLAMASSMQAKYEMLIQKKPS